MRAPKARSYIAQPSVRAPKAGLHGTCPSLHNRAGTFASHKMGFANDPRTPLEFQLIQ